MSQIISENSINLLQMLNEKIKSFGSQYDLFIEICMYSYTDLLVDYSPVVGDSIERYGETAIASIRVWQTNDNCGQATGTVVVTSDLDALLDTAANIARLAPPQARPPVAPVSITATAKTVEENLSGERARQRAIAFAHDLGQSDRAAIQTLLTRQTGGTIIIANSAGLNVIEHVCSEDLLLRCETQAGAIVDGFTRPSLDGPWDLSLLQARMQMALSTVAEEGDIPDTRLPVVLRPVAAAPMVAGMAWLLSGDTAVRTPTLAAACGHKIFPSALTVCDDPRHPLGARRRNYDDEGQQSPSLTLIKEGYLLSFLHSVQSAYKLSSSPNGRSFRNSRGAPPTSQATNLYLCPTNARLPRHYLEFTAKLETLKSMPRAGLVTMTVAGWEVRDGERRRRVRPVDLHFPLIPTLRKLVGVCDDLNFFPGPDGYGVPSLIFLPLLPGEPHNVRV